jgi:hypothetical protein
MIKVEIEHGVSKCEIGGSDKEMSIDILGLLITAYNAIKCISDEDVRKKTEETFLKIAGNGKAMKNECGEVYYSGSEEEAEKFDRLSSELKKLRKRIHELEEEKDND